MNIMISSPWTQWGIHWKCSWGNVLKELLKCSIQPECLISIWSMVSSIFFHSYLPFWYLVAWLICGSIALLPGFCVVPLWICVFSAKRYFFKFDKCLIWMAPNVKGNLIIQIWLINYLPDFVGKIYWPASKPCALGVLEVEKSIDSKEWEQLAKAWQSRVPSDLRWALTCTASHRGQSIL